MICICFQAILIVQLVIELNSLIWYLLEFFFIWNKLNKIKLNAQLWTNTTTSIWVLSEAVRANERTQIMASIRWTSPVKTRFEINALFCHRMWVCVWVIYSDTIISQWVWCLMCILEIFSIIYLETVHIRIIWYLEIFSFLFV